MTGKNVPGKVTPATLAVALGIIYGDIGTSPLYVLKAIAGEHALTGTLIYGGVSCVFWTLTLQTTLKYIWLTLKADNHGEGGIFSLYALVRRYGRHLVIPTILGATALLADGIITPPISVASAVEGLTNIEGLENLQTVPIVIGILSVLFFFQRFGTWKVGTTFGPAMVLWFSMLWISGLPPKYIAVFALAGVVLGMLAFPFLENYQQQRVLTFVFPDPNARHGATYNVEQALISIGSGGLTGMGYGHGSQVQLRYLKVRHTDFIFSAMAEEFGFIGTVLIIVILGIVIMRILRAARLAADPLGSMICYGIAATIFFQCVTAIGMNLGILPVTGLTLPLVSSGGTSLMSILIGIGLVESVVVRRRRFA